MTTRITRRTHKRRTRQSTRKRGGLVWNQSKSNIVALRQNLADKTTQEKQWIEHLEKLLHEPANDEQTILQKSANQLMFPSVSKNNGDIAYYQKANAIRLKVLNEIASNRIHRRNIIHTLAILRNRDAKNIANYAAIIATLPLSQDHSPLAISMKTKNIKQRIAEWKETDQKTNSVSIFDLISKQYDTILNNNGAEPFRLNITFDQRDDIDQWIQGGMELIDVMMKMLETSDDKKRQVGTISVTWKVLYFVAKGAATRLKEFAKDAANKRGGTVTKADEKPCADATKRAALLYHSWMDYQLYIGVPGITQLKVDQALRKLESAIKMGCISL